MSILSSIKRAFGFGGDDYDDEEYEEVEETIPEADPAVEAQLSNSGSDPAAHSASPDGVSDSGSGAAAEAASPDVPAKAEPTSAADKDAQPQSKPEENALLASDLFDGVLELFNAALPGFVARSIDAGRQRRQLIAELDNRLAERLEAEFEKSRRRGLEEIASEREAMDAELKRIRDLNKVLDERQRETNSAKLSAERQKRALKDRVTDLENQISIIEAEKEQLQLETKSMLSRMRAAGITTTGEAVIEAPDNSEAIETLRREYDDKLTTAKADNLALSDRVKAAELKAEEAAGAAEEAQISLEAARDSLDELSGRNAQLATELDRAAKERAEAESRAAESDKRNEALIKSVEQFKAAKELSDAMINSLQSQASEAIRRAEELEQRMADGNYITPEQLTVIEQQVDQFTAIREKLETRVKSLREENSTLRDELDRSRRYAAESLEAMRAAKAEAAAARRLAEAATQKEPSAQEALSDVGPALPESDSEDVGMPAADVAASGDSVPSDAVVSENNDVTADEAADYPVMKPERRRRRKSPRISAIAETLESNDWFGAPSEDVPERMPSIGSDSGSSASDDFGYRSPQRRPAPTSDEQMSLW